MVLSFNNNPLFEAFLDLFLLSVFLLGFLHGTNFLVCLVIFYCELLIFNGNLFVEYFIVYYEDAFFQKKFVVASIQLSEAPDLQELWDNKFVLL